MSELEANAAPAAGSILGNKYRVERVLGVGGMGVVLAARHVHLGHQVAIKLLLPAAQRDPSIVQRFLREGQAAAALKSDHVVRMHDVDTFPPWGPALVLEMLDGEDLEAVIGRGPLPVQVAVDYVLQASHALEQAHALGIVHRDLKPKNLFLVTRSDGSPCIKILDFGISQVKTAETDHRLTVTGQIFGSPQYMAPEQMRESRNTDARTDIWAMGAIFIELCTGKPAFTASSMSELTARILIDASPRLRQALPTVPAAIDAAIARCLEKDPAARFASIRELAQALAPFSSSRGPTSGWHAAFDGRAGLGVSSALGAQPSRPTPSIVAVGPVAASTLPGGGASLIGVQTATLSPARRRRSLVAPAAVLVVLMAGAGGTYAVIGRRTTTVAPGVVTTGSTSAEPAHAVTSPNATAEPIVAPASSAAPSSSASAPASSSSAVAPTALPVLPTSRSPSPKGPSKSGPTPKPQSGFAKDRDG